MRRLKTTETEDRILANYLTCALWSSVRYDADGNDLGPYDYHFDTDAFTIASVNAAIRDIRSFVALCNEAGTTLPPADMIGYDLWLTRNHHGAGFWDRGYDNGKALTEWAHSLGDSDVYDHRGRLYLT